MQHYDYVIAGAGPGGCVLAHRLSADPAKTVLLIEAGPPDRNPFLHMPAGGARIMTDPVHTWPFQVEGGGIAPWVRGRTLGGSSSINGLVYVRGQPSDFRDLARLTSDDWNWEHIGAAYEAIETHALGAAQTRGTQGPLRITLPGREAVLERLIESFASAGLARQADVNAPDDLEKTGYVPRNIFGGRRQSAAVAFLNPVRHRPNLHIRTGVLVDKVTFEGTRASGLGLLVDGKTEHVTGARIILCGGTLSSPAMLQRSGIGPAGLLDALGIEVRVDRPDVGRNMREHIALMMQWRLNKAISNNESYRGPGLLLSVARYYLTRGGPLSGAVFQMGGWFKTRGDLERPDIQVLAASMSMDYRGPRMGTERDHGIQAAVGPLRPNAKGSVQIVSRDPTVLPEVSHDFFASAEDRREMVGSVRKMRQIMAQGPIAEVIDHEMRPGPSFDTDGKILEAFKTMGTCAWHAAGTCRMGNDDDAVVDPMTRVRGVDRLHVVDLSIAPIMLAGNSNAPTTALAWRAADLIRQLDS